MIIEQMRSYLVQRGMLYTCQTDNAPCNVLLRTFVVHTPKFYIQLHRSRNQSGALSLSGFDLRHAVRGGDR